MKMRTALALLQAIVLIQSAWGRGGGGCFEQGTLILTPAGKIPIERLKAGDTVLTVFRGQLQPVTVRARVQVQPADYLELTFAGRKLRVTGEHPFAVGPGEFREISRVHAGETLIYWDGRALCKDRLQFVERVKATSPAYNLLVAPFGTFLADGVLVHNKGCFLPDTPVLRADGSSVAISEVRPGDKLLAFTADGAKVHAKAHAVFSHEVNEYFIVATESMTLRVTPEHPFYVGNGTFKTLETLRLGDRVFAWDGAGLRAQTIVRMEKRSARVRVYNVQTDSPHTFFASGIAVHNKGGCFPAGTPIRTPRGDVSIEKLHPGDAVLGVDDHGRAVATMVSAIFATRSTLLVLETEIGELRTTQEHPLLTEEGSFRNAGECRAGERIMALRRGGLRPAIVFKRRESLEQAPVFNLRVGPPHTFIASGFVAHNKGGFGGGHSSSGRSSGGSDGGSVLVFFVVIGVFVLILVIAATQKKRDEDLDFVFSRAAIAPKLNKTVKLLEFIGRVDPAFAQSALEQVAEGTFLQLQRCWQQRRYDPMKSLLTPDLYTDHCAQIAGLIRNHEINMIAGLEVKRIDIVNVRYTHKPDDREFTALITASARDYYVDDRTNAFLRGDEAPAMFQEFWTFQFMNGRWLLREVEQTRESDALKDENFFEPFTDHGVEQVYGEAAAQEGPTGPWLERPTETKATRIERLLNFLVNTDRIWNRQSMLERARQVFIRVFLAWEQGDPDSVPKADLFPEYAAKLAEGIRQQTAGGLRVEYRNLCVRKVELILVRNFVDNTRDEFTARISAHAQYIVRQQGRIIRQDEYVSPFVEYWTFGRQNGEWKLKEVLPPAEGEKALSRENVDEESSADQLQWYYQKTRAI